MKKRSDEILENEIGMMGSDPTLDDHKSSSMGKLKHAEAYGGKPMLTDEEKKDLDDFLSRSRRVSNHNNNSREDLAPVASISGGWIPLDRSTMGKRSDFYPESWEFMIRPATVQAIKNWTAIDETRLDQVNKVFNDIIRTCVKINTHDTKGAGWGQINSWDRFWFILKVREYTFVKGDAKVEFSDECPECGENIMYNLTSDSLFYEFPDDDLIEKYWSGSNWIIDPTEYGVNDEDEITLYTPKLGKDDAIIDWITMKKQTHQNFDEGFIKFLVWMLNNPSKDPQILDRQISKLYKVYTSWSIDMFTFMDDVINNITINQSERLKQVCPSCGGEAVSTVQFPNGIKELFKVKSDVKKFGSR